MSAKKSDLSAAERALVKYGHARIDAARARASEFDFREGDVIKHVSLPWALYVATTGTSSYFSIPFDSLALVLSVEDVDNDWPNRHKVVMCSEGVVGWSIERPHQWAKHWKLVARAGGERF